MTGISLFFDDRKLCRLLALELAANGYTVFEQPCDCALLIFDADSLKASDSGVRYGKCLGISRRADEKSKKEATAFIARPVLMRELRDTVAALLKPPDRRSKKPSRPRITLDDDARCALIGGESVKLSRHEFALLSLLAARRGEAVTRAELDSAIGANQGNMTDVYICRLRRKLESNGIRCISSVRGVGYKLF